MTGFITTAEAFLTIAGIPGAIFAIFAIAANLYGIRHIFAAPDAFARNETRLEQAPPHGSAGAH